MTALIDWRNDASLPTRTMSWPVWTIALVLVGVAWAGVMVAVTAITSDAAGGACRLREARDGIPGLEMAVPVVGQRPDAGWQPPRNVRVRYVKTADFAPGSVVDETMCGQPAGQVLVTLAR